VQKKQADDNNSVTHDAATPLNDEISISKVDRHQKNKKHPHIQKNERQVILESTKGFGDEMPLFFVNESYKKSLMPVPEISTQSEDITS
jgi:hypothetical protein